MTKDEAKAAIAASKRTGGNAFPGLVYYKGADCDLDQQASIEDGMTLRDYFAAKVVHGAMANSSVIDALSVGAKAAGIKPAARIAMLAYEFADAMLAERAK